MAEFDYSQYDNGDDYTVVDAIYDMLHQADNTSRPMSILLECYNKYENHTPEADRVANDKEALDWLDDYWEYVCWNERGNQIGMEELGGFKGMAETITNPYFAQQVIDYLQYDDEINDDTQDLIDRLKQITARYNGVNKMKKSSYEDLISAVAIYNDWMPISKLRNRGFDDTEIMQAVNDGHLEMKYDGKYVKFVKSAKKMKKSIDIEQLARDVTDLYEDIDPYAIRDVFDSIEEAYQGNLDALMTWNSDEIQRSIIDNLQEYADEGYTGNGSISVVDVISKLKELTATKSTRKMKKSAFDNIPQTFYVDMNDGRSITFSKEEYPLGVRWLHDNKDVRFYTTEGEEVFPVLQFSESGDGKALMLFEEKDWANDYCGEYTDATGINAVIEFERFVNDVLSDDVYIDYGDEEVMESTKKMKKAIIEEGAEFNTPKGIMRINSIKRTYDDRGNCISWWLSCEYVDEPDGWGKYIEYSDSNLLDMMERGEISRIQKKSTKKMKKSLFDIEDRFDELPDNLKEIARNLRWTLQVNDPVIDEREGDYYFLFDYHDGDPEYYFDELNIQQNSEEQYNCINLNEIERNPPEWMKKSILSIHDMIAQTRANNNSLTKSRVDLNIHKNNNRSVRGILNDGMSRWDKQLRPMTLSDKDDTFKFKLILPHELLANIYVPQRAVTRFEDITDDNLLDYADSVTFENISGDSMQFDIDDYVDSDQYESIRWQTE